MSDIVIIGGGIIGLTAAERLMCDGHQVTLVERDHIAAGASAGNAAGLAFPEVFPLASPGVFRKALKWFIDPLGPFAVVPQDVPQLSEWLLRFALASNRTQYEKGLLAKVSLNALSSSSWDDLLVRTGLTEHKSEAGSLHLFENKEGFKAEMDDWASIEHHGIAVTSYEGTALHQFQHGLSNKFVAGIHSPGWHSVSNPKTICEKLHSHLDSKGMKTVYGNVQSIDVRNGVLKSVNLTEGKLPCDKAIVAAGPWSSRMTAWLGDHIPLIGERGYNTTLPKSAMNLSRTLVFGEHGFVVTPLVDGVRIGGASEIAKLGRAPNYRRSKAMLQNAKNLLPDLDTKNGVEWMGARPTTSDTLPVIGKSSWSNDVVYAFGHSHLGLTQSAGTALLISELIREKEPSIDISPFRPDRF